MLALIIIAQIAAMISYVRKNNQQMARFLLALEHNDFTHRPSFKNAGISWKELYDACDLIMQKMEQLRAAKEEKHLFLQIITEQASVGLLCYDEKGEISLYNTEAQRIIGLPYLHNISGLEKISSGLSKQLNSLVPSERNLIKIIRDSSLLQLVVRASKIKTAQGESTLLCFQHIGAELEEQEVAAWQKLISVLTHEVMNTITPVISLAGTARHILSNLETNRETKNNESWKDLADALETIEQRSKGMLGFVSAYRKMNKVRVPELQEVILKDCFRNMEQLNRNKLHEKGISFGIELYPESLRVFADPDLLDQVLLNLISNAADALEGISNASIRLSARQDSAMGILISVSDNGTGISEEIADKIFVPFFSTKTHGTGIGLSLSKQIMMAHGGDISTYRTQGQTFFTLHFRGI
jgi:nitrogen fixation/metabolism regulation signal transduction histidine kinase